MVEVGHRRGVRVHRRRAAAALRAATPTSRCGWPPATPRPAPRSRSCTRASAAAYPDLAFTPYDPAAVAGLDLVFLGLPHGASQAIVPELLGKVGHLVDLAADFRLQDPSLYPQWYGEAHTAPELLPDFAYGLPELFRDEIRAADHVATPGCYPTAAALALAPLVRAGLVETDGIIVDAASGRVGRRPAARSRTPRSAPSTRTSPPTGCSTTATRPRWSRCSAPPCCSRPHLAPMNRGHPRHLLRPAHRRRPRTDALLDLPADGLRRRAVRRRHRRLAVHQGHPRLELRPRHRPLRRAHRLGRGHRRHRQPHQGRVGRGRAVRQPPPRPPRDHRPPHRRGSTHERHRARGVHGRRGSRAASRRRATPT